jgi:hypothetical protein
MTNKDDKQHYLYTIIRWIIFIPVSILGGQAFYAILIFINQIRPFGGSPGYIVSFSCAFLSGVVTIWLGTYLAPHFRKRVVIGYVIVTALGALSMIFLDTFLKYSFIENFRYIAHLMGIFGMGWLLYSNEIYKDKENSID